MNLSGYLNDPYKVVPIGPTRTPRRRCPRLVPTARSRRAIVAKYSHYFLWGASVNVLYRYYYDDWSVHANTLDVTYNHRLGADWIVSPEIRFYTQTGAYFFANRFLVRPALHVRGLPALALRSFLGGLTVTRRLDESFSANVGATIPVPAWPRSDHPRHDDPR